MKREERDIEYDERINRYLRGLMGDDERKAFEQEVDSNEELRERLVSTSLFVQGIAQEGMRREGQYQLDAIKEMSPEEYDQAIGRPKGRALKWAAAVATLAIGAGTVFYPLVSRAPLVAKNEIKTEAPAAPAKPIPTHTRPTLASLADEYNKPIVGEPDEFVAIRQQIQNEDSKDMMAVVYDIDKIEAPASNEGAMGAENAEVIKEMKQMHNDCTRWYKALAFLKKGDKDSAIRELNELTKHGSNEDLAKRATALLKKLEK